MIRISSEAVEKAYAMAPASVRFFMDEGLLFQALADLMKKNAVSPSLTVPLAELGRNALLGLVPPQKFPEELVQIGVPPSAINTITTDFHELVVKKAAETEVPTEEESGVPAGIEQRMLPEGITRQTSSVSTAEVSIKKTNHPVTKLPPSPLTASRIPVSAPEPAHPRTMASDVEAMQGGGKPVIPKPVAAPHPIAPPRPAPPPTVAAVQEDLKKYGVDPYREPIQ